MVEIENELFEPITVVFYFIVLMPILYAVKKGVALSGSIAYYTHAIVPIISIILIRLGVSVIISVIIATIILEPINYVYYKKRILKDSQEHNEFQSHR